MKKKPTVKDLKTGTYVTRSVYNKVAEENKRLRLDISKLITGTAIEQTEVRIRWNMIYKGEAEFNSLLKEIYEYAKNNPEK